MEKRRVKIDKKDTKREIVRNKGTEKSRSDESEEEK